MGQWIAGSAFATAFYHSDTNGNVTSMVYPNGTLAAKYLYDSYGNTLSMSGPLAGANRYRFSSKEWINNAGLYYYGYRFYDPNLQRWLNRDPIAEAGGINLYGYVGNSPVNRIDPLGFQYDPYALGIIGNPSSVQGGGDVSTWGPAAAAGFTGAALAVTGVGLVADAYGSAIFPALGITASAADTPEGQEVMQEAEPLLDQAAASAQSECDALNHLLQEQQALEQALQEDQIAASNAKNIIAQIQNAGGTPNPYGLLQDLNSFEEGITAKQKMTNNIQQQINALKKQ